MILFERASIAPAMLLGWLAIAAPLPAQKVAIRNPGPGQDLPLWRITHDAVVDDHANYHQHQCWSHDGRYLAYRHCPAVASPQASQPYAGYYQPVVHVYDLLKDEDKSLGQGIVMLPGASWANQHNWLFYVQLKPEDRGFAPDAGAPVMWVDMETGVTRKIGDGLDQLGGVDSNDRWLFAGIKDPTRKPAFRTARVRIQEHGGVEELKEVIGFQWVANPRHPVFFTRHDNVGQPFRSTVSWWNPDGSNQHPGMLVVEAAHMAWQGNGEHFLIGDGLPRGRRWDEPAPSNVHVLAAGRVGNLSACGHSGRFAVGDSAMFDLRSGDTWDYRYFLPGPLKATQDFYPNFDGEAKGSPDGTKVAFTVRYDFEKGPVTELSEMVRPGDEVLRVSSTEDFPPSGALVIWTEIIGYRSKTPSTFEGLTRGLHGTRISPALAGRGVTDLTHHLLADEQWKTVTAVGNDIRLGTDPNSPLIRQRGRDVYVAVVRRPDRPWLRVSGETLQLIPGESHFETRGYHLEIDGRRVTTRLVQAGEVIPLKSAGKYAAVAVEWSGLESEPGNIVTVTAPGSLQVMASPPSDFSWTASRWMVGGKEIDTGEATNAGEAVHETMHRYDGVIARAWHKKGILTQHHDLNHEGKAIRRLTYEGGKLLLRDYYNRENLHVSRQVFAPDGYITETIALGNNSGKQAEVDHWWFDRALPVRRVAGGLQYQKQGDQWVVSPYRPQ